MSKSAYCGTRRARGPITSFGCWRFLRRKSARIGTGSIASFMIIIAGLAIVGLPGASGTADAAPPPISDARVIAHLDFSRGQTPENVALEPDGSEDVTFAEAAQVARVSRSGHISVLAQLPKPSTGTGCPILGSLLGSPALTVGIARDRSGNLYVALCTGTADLQGIWRIGRDGTVARFAALPSDGIPNGLALDEREGVIYVADSLLSAVWRVSITDGTVSKWAAGPQLAPDGGLGANGLKVHDGAVWVSNTQLGTLLRIPIQQDGSAGPIETAARGLNGIDDFAFTGPGAHAAVLAAINRFSQVDMVRPDGTSTTVLTAADGLSNPSSVAIRGGIAYVLSAAYLTREDPNILIAHIGHLARG